MNCRGRISAALLPGCSSISSLFPSPFALDVLALPLSRVSRGSHERKRLSRFHREQHPPTSNAASPPLVASLALPQSTSSANMAEPSTSAPQLQEGAPSQPELPPGNESKAPEEPIEALPEDADALLKEFFQEVKDTDRENEVIRILEAFKLNPFDQMDLRYDATEEDITKKYRSSSLLIHPDKCKHEHARTAFEVLRAAHKKLLDAEARNHIVYLLNYARDQVRKERKKATKHDAAIRLAATIHANGREGVEEDWEKTEDFHAKWKAKSMEVLAQAEWRKRKLDQRVKEDQLRLEEDEATAKERMKNMREHSKKWEETRETRVGGWRDFMNNQKSSKKKKKGAPGALRPPKLKTEDADKAYVQRPVSKQEFRPTKSYVPPTAHRK